MTKYQCPSCGAEVRFQSSVSVFAVCPYCRSMLVRHDLDVETLGTMAVLSDDTSPLQLQTQGQYKGTSFTLVGRLRVSWSEGRWNEWFALFDDGKHGWLGEAQGFYMISFERTDRTGIPSRPSLHPGQGVTIDNRRYQVDDIKEAVCAGSEGELPFQAVVGRKSTSVDMAGPDLAFACIEYADDGIKLFVGEYLQFDELQLKFLRQLDGW
jgi:hypothetical protein